MLKKFLLSMSVIATVSACAGYDQWAENTNRKINSGFTQMLNGKQTVDTSAVPKGFNINIAYGKGEGLGIPGPAATKFYDKLIGDVTYNKSCNNGLTFNVGMFNSNGSMVRTESVYIHGYQAGIKANINKDVMADPMSSKSNQVSKLVISKVKCI